MPSAPESGNFRFRMIGGGLQLQIRTAEDLKSISHLDEALWAMTGVDTDSLRFDQDFLRFLDCDHDGKIRSEEVKTALDFIQNTFRDISCVARSDEFLKISSISPDAPGAAEIIDCARLLLNNLNRSDDDGLSVDDIRNTEAVTSFSGRNGDGVIVCEEGLAKHLQQQISMIIASGRVSRDISGRDGVDLDNVVDFENALARRIALLEQIEKDPAILVYGEDTAGVYELFADCSELLDGYFLNSAAGRFLDTDPERAVKKVFSADLMVPADVRQALVNAAAAVPLKNGELDFNAQLNPLYAGKLRKLADSCALKGYLNGSVLTESAYLQAKNALEPYRQWYTAINEADGLEKFTADELHGAAAMPLDELKELIQSDLSLAPVVGAGETLLKMALYQRYMMAFLNNFVSLGELFNPEAPSHLQMGKLVMDGRHFTLTVRVKDLAGHKKIISSSNICVIYVEISRLDNGVWSKELLAAAVTSGHMRSLFVGKRGVFFDTDGVIYDAVIKDISAQPVSIGEAFRAPFYSFSDFISKQTEKIFNTRNAEVQKSMTAELNKSPLAAAPKTAPVPTPAPAAPAPVAGNFPMLLMGGGIGIAALGSSVAFIVKSLQNVSFITVLSVLAGIVIIFGGPSVIIALIKLYRRNLSRFLESCGCAVNRPMRMSRRMGEIFTFVPKRPKGEVCLIDPVNVFKPVRSRWGMIILLTAVILSAAAVTAYFTVPGAKAKVWSMKQQLFQKINNIK